MLENIKAILRNQRHCADCSLKKLSKYGYSISPVVNIFGG